MTKTRPAYREQVRRAALDLVRGVRFRMWRGGSLGFRAAVAAQLEAPGRQDDRDRGEGYDGLTSAEPEGVRRRRTAAFVVHDP